MFAVARMRKQNRRRADEMWARMPEDPPDPNACPDCVYGVRWLVEGEPGGYMISMHVRCETCDGSGDRVPADT